MFVYGSTTGMCHLKYKVGYKLTEKKGFITGYKYCPIPSGNSCHSFFTFVYFNKEISLKRLSVSTNCRVLTI